MKISPGSGPMFTPHQDESASPVIGHSIEAGEWINVKDLPEDIRVPFSLLDFMQDNTDLDPSIYLKISEWGAMYAELTGEQGLLARSYLAEDSESSTVVLPFDNQADGAALDSRVGMGLYLKKGVFPFARIINENAQYESGLISGYYICDPSESGLDVRYYRLDKYAGEKDGSIEVLVSASKDLGDLTEELLRR